MCDQIKLDGDGNCPCCRKMSLQTEQVKCLWCESLFHGKCNSATVDQRIGTKAMMTQYMQPNRKGNIIFYCDPCKTKVEIMTTQSDGMRINALEEKNRALEENMVDIKDQLQLITSMLKSKEGTVASSSVAISTTAPPSTVKVPVTNIWNNTEKLASLKADTPKAVLVIPKNSNPQMNEDNHGVVEKAVMDNQIVLKETFENKSGKM